MIGACPDKRNPADRAERRSNKRQVLSACRADMQCVGIRYMVMADVAERRQNGVKQCLEERPDSIHLKAHFSVDYQHMEISKAGFAIDNRSYSAEPVG